MLRAGALDAKECDVRNIAPGQDASIEIPLLKKFDARRIRGRVASVAP